MKYFIVALSIALFSLVNGAKLPSTFKICKHDEPDLNACFKEAVQVALPLLKNGRFRIEIWVHNKDDQNSKTCIETLETDSNRLELFKHLEKYYWESCP